MKKPSLGKWAGVRTTPESGAGRTAEEIERDPIAQAWIAWRLTQGKEYLGIQVNPFAANLDATAEKLRRRLSIVCLDMVMGVAFVFEEPNALVAEPIRPKKPAKDPKPPKRYTS